MRVGKIAKQTFLYGTGLKGISMLPGIMIRQLWPIIKFPWLLLRKVFGPTVDADITSISGGRERFVASMRRAGLGLDDLPGLINKSYRITMFFLGLVALDVIMYLVSILYSLTLNEMILATMYAGMLAVLMSAKALESATHNWCLRHQSFESLWAYLKASDKWPRSA